MQWINFTLVPVTDTLQPIVLFADSQLLFSRDNGELLVERLLKSPRHSLKAAYVGASNGDHPDFYEIFVSAMEHAGISDCRMIPSALTRADQLFLNEADIILLAGGDVEVGWNVFLKNGLSDLIVGRYREGALLIGISAGAAQLGLGGLAADGSLIETFKLVPFVIGAHEESTNWTLTKDILRLSAPGTPAIGLPTGGGALYHADGTLEPLRRPFVRLSLPNN